MRVCRGSLLLLVLASGMAAQDAPDEASPAALRQLAREQLERLDCQTELPGEEPGSGAGGRSRNPPAGGRDLPREQRGGSTVGLGGGGSLGLAELLFWVALVGIVAAVLVAVLRHVGGRSLPLPAAAKAVKAGPAAAPAPVAEVVPDHLLLAREGRFAEAIHALLLAALQLLARQLGRGLPREATGRDALLLAQPLPRSDTALRSLVRSVERSHFGGAAVAAADYEAAVVHFEQWSEACRSART